MTLDLTRGPQNSPILLIGDALPENSKTVNNLKELLDRRHLIYKSIIVPIKYYLNDYLISLYNYRLPTESRKDIFRFVNASKIINGKKEFQEDHLLYEIKSNNYRLIFCMGQDTYYFLRKMFEKYSLKCRKSWWGNPIQKLSIRDMGMYFEKTVAQFKKGDNLLLPILHNVSNLAFQHTDNFIPKEIRKTFISHDQYIAFRIATILMKEPGLTNFLIPL